MAFICRDCSYRGIKSGQGGQCPACGSFNVKVNVAPVDEPQPAAKWRLVVLGVLWTILLLMIIWKLIN